MASLLEKPLHGLGFKLVGFASQRVKCNFHLSPSSLYQIDFNDGKVKTPFSDGKVYYTGNARRGKEKNGSATGGCREKFLKIFCRSEPAQRAGGERGAKANRKFIQSKGAANKPGGGQYIYRDKGVII